MAYIFQVKGRMVAVGTLLEIPNHLDIRVLERTHSWYVKFNGVIDDVTYSKEFTREEVIRSFCKDRLPNYIHIYKGEKL